jgi:hypothetical protein
MSTIEKRRHARILHAANVKLTNATGESIDLKTRDFSDSGLFLKCTSEPIVKLGEQASVKVLDIEDALTQKIKIMRIDPGVGIGIEFL